MDLENRIVVLIDMDCFYCQVEEKLNPELKGKPIAVVQYNPWKGGGIIAVNYVARAMGVNRHMRGDDAKEKCPEIQLPSVPCKKGKANISKYRDAGIEVAKVLQRFTTLLERASIDEAYLDITIPVQKRLQTINVHTLASSMMPNTFALGYDSLDHFISDIHSCGSDSIEFDFEHAQKLLVGAQIVSEIRAAVFEETGYTCSAGIAHNKILAKLVCGMNKPNKQTVLPKHSVNILYKTLSVKKVKHLGGKFGDYVCEILKIQTMGQLQLFTERELQAKFDEKNGTWLYNIARGIDIELVQAKFNPKSIGCCKNFKGKSALLDLESVKKWLRDLGDEIEERLEKDALENNRTPKQMVISFSVQLQDGRDTSSSRSYNFLPDDELCGELFTNKAFEILLDSTEGCKPKEADSNKKLRAPITFLGISVGKFEDNTDNKKTKKIKDYFCAGSSKETVPKSNEATKVNETKITNINNIDKNYILHKFLQTNNDNEQIKEETMGPNNEKVLESPLDKQESFFAKFLKKGQENKKSNQESHDNGSKSLNKVNSPICNIIECGDDSNDTVYSGSTINEEINKSIALFEDDPLDIARVSNMRELLKTTENEVDKIVEVQPRADISSRTETPEITDTSHIETVECFECGKAVPLNQFDEHADYHIALKLREEEREVLRKTKDITALKEPARDVKKKKSVQELNKNEAKPSISKFFTKFDMTAPVKMCTECGEKIAVEKFCEHLDFHEAQKLSRELNKKNIVHSYASSSGKRQRISTSPIKKTKLPCKSIDMFFR
ncbi:DNA polymerase eta isoform X1 [Vanessa atalanta]|uniref:DNA polymerase eta isoform X1 n=2 Tax=Vanessa atalanta TaxID=42275 RepID=UPI001FCDF048|nr:DNA polymerase eta isoform X1 [Vanessa atalanta]